MTAPVLGVPLPPLTYRNSDPTGTDRWYSQDQLITYARAVAAAQRERDAQLCETHIWVTNAASAIRSQE